MLESQAVLVASKRAVIKHSAVLHALVLLSLLSSTFSWQQHFSLLRCQVTANMKGRSAEEVAERILSQPSLSGLQGPTISPVFSKRDGKVIVDYYAIVICVPKKDLYTSVQQLRGIGGSGVLVSPLTYIFDAEPPRWADFLMRLGL
ncbi:hypothetical protein Syun_025428 [Stephania yunnanensis]|uniref:Histidine biosynthesis HisG C-terminal domain-containing protein n=1 Tax=Stephania yunnanensis TaxID=152371 RepID=A0AAP0HR91_9MAGN